MIKKIVTDTFFLSIKSKEASLDDIYIVQDLKDTLNAYGKNRCVGLASNMIGYNKRIIIVYNGFNELVMLNPKLISKSQVYATKEGCLSIAGVRDVTRYKKIKVRYQDINLKWHEDVFVDLVAQAIQHEMDHLEGILV